MFWELLFGVLLILWGISHITSSVFNIHIPVFGIIFGLFLLYLGVELISGFSYWPKNCCSHCNESSERRITSMCCSNITINDGGLSKQESPWEYKTIMGNSLIDLSHISSQALQTVGVPFIINVDTVLGATEVIVPKNVPTRVIAKSGCSQVVTPDDCSIIFGAHTYNSHLHEQPLLIIYSSTICGKTVITTAQ
jgi:predicted membrane protein